MSQPPTLKIESTKGRRLFAVGISNRVLIANASRGSDSIQFASRPVQGGDEIIITLNGVPHSFTYTYAKPDFDEILLRRPVGIDDFEPIVAPVPVKMDRVQREKPAYDGQDARSAPIGGTGSDILVNQGLSPGVRPFDSSSDKLASENPHNDLSTLIVEGGKISASNAPPPPA
jgi:hypothetical protein